MKGRPAPVVVKKASGSKLKNLKSTYRSNKVLLGDIERHVVTNHLADLTRNPHVIHPSEICKSDTCRRAIYYRLIDEPADLTNPDIGFHLQRVFDEGHDIHNKYQGWLWDMGVLYGVWECVVCDRVWFARSPVECISCGAPKYKLRYKEVPVESKEHMLAGKADGLVEPGLIEVKSVGLGTLRFEAPGFHDKFYKGEWTLQETWNAIKRPFPTHIRQGMLYSFMKGGLDVIFIYEWKPSQTVKEFVVKFDESIVNPILEVCLDIKWAVEKRRPVDRPHWAEPKHKECRACPYKGTCYGDIQIEAPKLSTKIRSKKTGEPLRTG